MSGGRHLHVLGVCGTAMAAIAALAKEAGWRVTGSDAGVYPPMSDYLAEIGVPIAPYAAENLEPAPDLCVVGNALSRGNIEVEAMLDRGLPYCSGPEFVGRHLLPGRHPVVVAGTHGKTTTASLLAHMLETAGRKPGFLIGGVPENFGGGARTGAGEAFVLEGDEYDTAFFDKRSKFLHYRPRTLILNNLEYDHADIFPDLEAIKTQFRHLLRIVPAAGALIVNADDANLADVLAGGCWTPQVRFARHDSAAEAEWRWRVDAPDGTRFTLLRDGREWLRAGWRMIGAHHAANACAAAAAADAMGAPREAIARAIESFAGVRRRMTLVGEAGGVRVYDDFAHHPTAIAGIVAAARHLPEAGGRLWVIIEPRSNTMRSRVHEARLPQALAAADEVVFAPPVARGGAGEALLDVAGVCRAIGAHARVLPDAGAIAAFVAARAQAGDVALVLSNGGFDGIHRRLLEALAQSVA